MIDLGLGVGLEGTPGRFPLCSEAGRLRVLSISGI